MSSRYSSPYHRFKGRYDDENEYYNAESIRTDAGKRYSSPYYYSGTAPPPPPRHVRGGDMMFDRPHQEYHHHVDDIRERTIPDISRSPSVATHDLDIMLDKALGRAHISIPVAPQPPPPPPPPAPMSSRNQQHRSPSPAPRIPRTRYDGEFYPDIPTSRVGERRDQSRHRSPARYYDRRDDAPSFTPARRADFFEHGDQMQYQRRPDNGPVFEPGPRPYNYRPDYGREDNGADGRTEYRSNYGHGYRSDHDDHDFRSKNRYDQWYDGHNPTRADYDNYDPRFMHERERCSPAGDWENTDSRNHHYERHGEGTKTENTSSACPPSPAQPYSSTINITLVGEQPHGGGATRQVSLHSSGTMAPPMAPTMSDWRDVDDRVITDDARNSTRHRCWHWSRNKK